jgi:hypothetical protein
MNKITKTSLISLAVAAAVAVAPQAAFAHKVHHKAHKAAKAVAPAVTRAAPVSYNNDSRFSQLEAEIQALRAELSKNKSATASIAEKADASQKAVEARLVEHEANSSQGKNTLSFRGGYAKNEHARGTANNGIDALAGVGTNKSDIGEGWYVGASIDHRLTNNLWGLSDIAAVDGELMFEYKNFGTGFNAVTGTLNKITQFTLTAAPKVKFNTGTIFTPWIIPVGLGVHVISPPSNGVTVLNPGLMVGAGGEVEILPSLVAGLDFRYHFTGDDLKGKQVAPTLTNPSLAAGTLSKGVSTTGFTSGAYLGFKF